MGRGKERAEKRSIVMPREKNGKKMLKKTLVIISCVSAFSKIHELE